jgi:hypothetical protein
MTAVLAGRLTPAANVGVAEMILMLPDLNAASTIRLCSRLSPAWWNAAPFDTVEASSSVRRVFSPRRTISEEIFSSSVCSLFLCFPLRAWLAVLATLWARRRLSTKMRDCPPPATEFMAMLTASILCRGSRRFTLPSLKMIPSFSATPSLRGTGLHSVFT